MRKIYNILRKVHAALCEIWLVPIKFYRKYLSRLKPAPSCRFTPTCSQYAVEAVREWGLVAGTILALWRVIRCNPFSDGGYDPVPKKSDIFHRKK